MPRCSAISNGSAGSSGLRRKSWRSPDPRSSGGCGSNRRGEWAPKRHTPYSAKAPSRGSMPDCAERGTGRRAGQKCTGFCALRRRRRFVHPGSETRRRFAGLHEDPLEVLVHHHRLEGRVVEDLAEDVGVSSRADQIFAPWTGFECKTSVRSDHRKGWFGLRSGGYTMTHASYVVRPSESASRSCGD